MQLDYLLTVRRWIDTEQSLVEIETLDALSVVNSLEARILERHWQDIRTDLNFNIPILVFLLIIKRSFSFMILFHTQNVQLSFSANCICCAKS
mmetsp:Transcript_15538/g.38339  ORF Transcript_15538/g.38339 Transcript_15538/m.38339 type:complete len:93 (-) Transcript_15538:751-1029(-)